MHDKWLLDENNKYLNFVMKVEEILDYSAINKLRRRTERENCDINCEVFAKLDSALINHVQISRTTSIVTK